jgi:hypothetical protein
MTMKEVNLAGLKKTQIKKLDEISVEYIDYFTKAKGCPPPRLRLYAAFYDSLEKTLKEKGHTLKGCTYKGLPVRRNAS